MLTEEHFDMLTRFRVRAMGDKLREMVEDVNVNLSFTDSAIGPHPFAPTHMRRSRQHHPPFPASRSGARSLVR